jgi:hypothetical protein
VVEREGLGRVRIDMFRVNILDLPAGYGDWRHHPFRSTEFTVWSFANNKMTTRWYNAADPLILRVGDFVVFQSKADIPQQLRELTFDNTGHPVYAALEEVSDEKLLEEASGSSQSEQSTPDAGTGPVFVG